jgi:uncharacterized membrane protein YfcA
MLSLVAMLAVGALAGFLAGLLGIGGGIVIVAALAFLLPGLGVPRESVMHVALATSLASIVATAISSSLAHWRRGSVIRPSLARLAPGMLVGGWLGALIADRLDGDWLRLGVAGFCLLMAWQLARRPAAPDDGPGVEPAGADLVPWGVGIGALSALVGIGGGSLTVPLLVAKGARTVRAVGTSAACGLAIALASAAGFAWHGRDAAGLPAGSLGYVYLPAALAIAVTSVLAAPWGVAAAHRIGGTPLKRIFALFLVAMGAALLTAYP